MWLTDFSHVAEAEEPDPDVCFYRCGQKRLRCSHIRGSRNSFRRVTDSVFPQASGRVTDGSRTPAGLHEQVGACVYMETKEQEEAIGEQRPILCTPIGRISLEDGVAVIELDKEVLLPQHIEDHVSIMLGFSQQTGDIAIPVMMDFGNLRWVGWESRVCAAEITRPEWTTRFAILYRNPVQKVLAAFFAGIDHAQVPIMITGDREAALKWLKDPEDNSFRLFDDGHDRDDRAAEAANAIAQIGLGMLSTRTVISKEMDDLDAVSCGLNMIAEEMYGLFAGRDRVEREASKYRVRLEKIVGERTSEVKEVNESLKREIEVRALAEERLARINGELEGFAHTVSHDLKNPLAAIETASEALRRMVVPSVEDYGPEVVEVFDLIERNVDKANRLIEDLLTLARAGQFPERMSDIDIRGVVLKIIEERADHIEEGGVAVNVGKDLGVLPANETHMYQVFSNLIENAIKHNPENGLTISVSSPGTVDGKRRYLVRDSGRGLQESDLDKLFIPFFKGADGQTGIGLSIVEKIVKLYGGCIRAYNDGGACFEFTIGALQAD